MTERVVHYFQWLYQTSSIELVAYMYAALLVLELFFGRKERQPWSIILKNCLFVLSAFPIILPLRVLVGQLSNGAVSFTGGPFLDGTIPNGGTWYGQIYAAAASLFVIDFFYYWHHRLQHGVPAFWTIHKLHHREENLGVTSAYKHHWTEELLRFVTVSVPTAVIFRLEPITMFAVLVVISFHQLFIHANLNWTFGPFNYLVTSPVYHRVHHSTLDEHLNKNFASTFPIYDIIFGTYCAPPKIAPPTGIASEPRLPNLMEEHVSPFKEWYRMLRNRIGRNRAAARWGNK